MIEIAIGISVVTALFIVLVTIRNVIKEKSSKSVAVLCGALAYVGVFLLAVCRIMGILPARIDVLGAAQMNCIRENVLALIPIVFGLFHMFTAFIIWRKMSFGNYIMIVVAIFILLSMLFSFLVDINPIESLFVSCCGIMAAVAYALGLTYKEFCMLGNIYVQCAIMMWSGLYLLYKVVKLQKGKHGVLNVIFGLLVTLYNVGLGYIMCWICYRYKAPLEPAFDLCYQDLMNIANTYKATLGTNYEIVNIVLFIVVFLGVILMNIGLAKILKWNWAKNVVAVIILLAVVVESVIIMKMII